jgi:hypothetical protein
MRVQYSVRVTALPIYQRNAAILSAPSGAGEVMMMAIETNRYYAATEVGAQVWELLETPHSIAALCEAVRAEFDVDEATCAASVTRFVQELVKDGLAIEVSR